MVVNGGRLRPEEADAAHVVALLPHEEALPADVLVRVGDRGLELVEGHHVTAQAIGVDLDVVFLRLAAVAGDVDDALHLLELALEDPVLRRLQVLQRVAIADDAITQDFADGIPRRELCLHAGRKGDELDSIDDFLARVFVRRIPVEVTFDVAEAEQGAAANVIEPRHAREADFERYCDVAFGLLRAPPRRLRDELHERRHRVRIRLDIELLVRRQTDRDQQDRGGKDDDRHP